MCVSSLYMRDLDGDRKFHDFRRKRIGDIGVEGGRGRDVCEGRRGDDPGRKGSTLRADAPYRMNLTQ